MTKKEMTNQTILLASNPEKCYRFSGFFMTFK